jgi:CBS domain-containing protein
VCDDGDVVGVLTKTDIVGQIGRCMGVGCTVRVDSVMTRDVTSCRAYDALLDVWSVMSERGLQRIPVIDETRRRLGVIYARDGLQALLTESVNEDELLRDCISGIGYR